MTQTPLLTSLALSNYRNINTGVSFPNPAIFIGPNGSGKSNLFEGIQFLQSVITESSPGSMNKTIKKFGGISSIYSNYVSGEDLSFSYKLRTGDADLDNIRIQFDLSVDNNAQEVTVTKDIITLGEDNSARGSYSYGVSASQALLKSMPRDFSKTKMTRQFKSDISIKDIKVNPDDSSHKDALEKLEERVQDWRFYNANNFSLKSIRLTPCTIDTNDIYLYSDGTNISNTYFNIVNSLDRHVAVAEIENFIKDNIDVQFSYIKTPIFDNRFVSLAYKRANCNKAFNLETLSDGLVRMLMWTIVLLHPTPPSLIVIDEPELGLHPQWMKPLMELVWRAAEKTQVIIATHSPDLLDHLDADEAGHVIVAEQDEQGLARFNTLDPEALAQWLKNYTLGDLYRLGRPEIGGWG